jgi:hypothetical protein
VSNFKKIAMLHPAVALLPETARFARQCGKIKNLCVNLKTLLTSQPAFVIISKVADTSAHDQQPELRK